MTDARTIPCFPAPSDELVAMTLAGHKIRAMRAYKAEARATLLDGTVVAPNLKTLATMFRAIAGGFPAMPMAVSEGGYVTQAQLDAEAAAAKLKQERFEMFMAEDKPPMRGECRCDHCGTFGPCDNHYAPDATGYPTLVLTTNDCCKGD